MVVIFENSHSESDRLKIIKSAYTSLGNSLYSIAQASKNIDAETKEKLNKSICQEYSRQEVIPFLSSFATGKFTLDFDENNAIRLGEIISSFSDKEYNELLIQAKQQSEIFDRKIDNASSSQPNK